MCDILIPALLGLGLVAAISGGGGDCCDNACYSACSTCGTASQGAANYNGGYGYTPTYAPAPAAPYQKRYTSNYGYAPSPNAGYSAGGYSAGYSNANYSSYGGWR